MDVLTRLQSIETDPYVSVILAGDNTRLACVSLWHLQSTACPGAYWREYKDTFRARCTLWNVPYNVTNTSRFFFVEDVSYCLLLYDADLDKDEKRTLQDYLQRVSYCSKASIIVILLRDNTEDIKICTSLGLHYIVCPRGDIQHVESLLSDLCEALIKERETASQSELLKLLHLSE